jgi:ABC-type multidrug transport system fused ATPase/permease subunit
LGLNDFLLLIRRLRRHSLLVLVALALIVLSAFTEGFSVLLVIPILEGLGQDTQGVTEGNRLLEWLDSFFADVPQDRLLQTAAALFVGVTLARVIIGLVNAYIQARLQYQLDRELREEVYFQLLHLSFEQMNQKRDADWALILNSETGRAANAIFGLVGLASSLFTMLVYLSVLVAISWQMTALAALLLIGVFAILTSLVRLSDYFGQKRLKAALEVQYATMETLNAKRLIRTLQQQSAEEKRYNALLNRLQRTMVALRLVGESSRQLLEMIVVILLALMLILGGAVLNVDQQTLIPIVSAFILIVYRMLPHVLTVNAQRTVISSDLASIRSIAALLSSPHSDYIHDGTQAFTGLKESIRFQNVTFHYAKRNKAALHDVSFEIPVGKTVALVGSSGAGKSTLADLLIRLYDPQSGQILVDGQDLRTLRLADWRGQLGVVSQDTFIFNNSIAYNIAYGAGAVTPEEIRQAACYANADAFIQDLPQGYETVVGDRGVLLSGGQRQRIAIARAILRNPQILILDEATSALDSENEKQIQAALDFLSHNRTTLVIAHRLSTILKADQIIVLEAGRVVENGPHAELLARGGRYAQLYHTQFENALQEPV